MKLEYLLDYRNYDLDALKQKFNIEESDLDHEVGYQKLKNLTRVRKEKLLPGHFYYYGNSVSIIYVNDRTVLDTLEMETIYNRYGRGEILPSRMGKNSRLHLYASHGFAVSEHEDKVDFMELFPPTTIEQYKENVYLEVQLRR